MSNYKFNFQESSLQSQSLITLIIDSFAFAKEHELWRGLFRYRWVFVVTILIGILYSIWTFADLIEIFSSFFSSEQNNETHKETAQSYFSLGSKRYLLLLLLEILIFHISVRTHEILSNRNRDLTLSDFIRAEKRMFFVLLYSLVIGFILTLVAKIIFGIFGLSILSNSAEFLINSFFVGFAFLDNYNEQIGLTIKESYKLSKKHIIPMIIIGTFARGLLIIPILGAILTPLYCSIIATRYGYQNVELET